jgi:small ligand-binding sensory domain FIST
MPNANACSWRRYVIRNIAGFDPRQGVIAVGDYIRQGQKMVFTLRRQRISEDLKVTA